MSNLIIDSLITFADEFPDTIALVGDHEAISYKEMLLRALNIADWFGQVRVSRIGLYRENSIEWIIIDLAALIAKVTLVPIPRFFSNQKIRHLIHETGLDLVLSDDIKRFRQIDRRFLNDGLTIANTAVLWPPFQINGGCGGEEDCAKITFTSGSSGRPKGVCLSRKAIELASFSLASRLSGVPTSKHLNLLPFSSLLENVAGIYAPLIMEKQVHVYSRRSLGLSESAHPEAFDLYDKLNEVQADSFILLPQMLSALIRVIEQKGPLKYGLTFIGLGGEKVAPALIRKARTLGLPVYEGYGLVECGSVITLNLPSEDRIGSVGKPLIRGQVKLEGDSILVKSKGFLGYLGEAPADEEWIDTGDLGRLDDEGFLYVTGRKEEGSRGAFAENISPEWIEHEFMKFPWMRQCVVFGDARPFCSAVFVPRNPEFNKKKTLRFVEQINARLPQYAQIKRWVVTKEPFTVENGLLSPSAQPLREQILARYQPKLEPRPH